MRRAATPASRSTGAPFGRTAKGVRVLPERSRAVATTCCEQPATRSDAATPRAMTSGSSCASQSQCMNEVRRQAAELSQRLSEEVECIVALRKERSAWPGAAPHAGRSPPHTRRRAGEGFDPHAIDLEPLGVSARATRDHGRLAVRRPDGVTLHMSRCRPSSGRVEGPCRSVVR